MADRVHFISASGSIAINGPVSTDLITRPHHVMAETANYTVFAYKKTSTLAQDWTLVFDALSDSQKATIQDFFFNKADGPSRTFSYEHTDGQIYTARFLDTQLQFQRRPNNWGLTVRLRIEGGVEVT